MTPELAPLRPGEELVDAASFSAHWSRAGASVGPGSADRVPLTGPTGSGTAAALEVAIGAATTRLDVERLAAKLAASYAQATAVLVVRRGWFEIVASERCGGDDSIVVVDEVSTVFQAVMTRVQPFHGPPPHHPLDRSLLGALGRADVREIALLPCALGTRVVSLLYADNGPDPFAEGALAALDATRRCVTRAYTRLILNRRLAHQIALRDRRVRFGAVAR